MTAIFLTGSDSVQGVKDVIHLHFCDSSFTTRSRSQDNTHKSRRGFLLVRIDYVNQMDKPEICGDVAAQLRLKTLVPSNKRN
jgi:hypothetical protein